MNRIVLRLVARAGFLAPVLFGACAKAPADASSPALVRDLSALRARASACLGLDAAAAVSLFGPELVGGTSEPTEQCLETAETCEAALACFEWLRDVSVS